MGGEVAVLYPQGTFGSAWSRFGPSLHVSVSELPLLFRR